MKFQLFLEKWPPDPPADIVKHNEFAPFLPLGPFQPILCENLVFLWKTAYFHEIEHISAPVQNTYSVACFLGIPAAHFSKNEENSRNRKIIVNSSKSHSKS